MSWLYPFLLCLVFSEAKGCCCECLTLLLSGSWGCVFVYVTELSRLAPLASVNWQAVDGFLISWESVRKLVSGDTTVCLWRKVTPTWKWSHPHSWRGWAECCFWNLGPYPNGWCSFVSLPMTVIGASWGLSWALSWVISSPPCQRTVAPGTFGLDPHYGLDLNS